MYKRVFFLLLLIGPVHLVLSQTLDINVQVMHNPGGVTLNGHPLLIEVIPDSLQAFTINGNFNSSGFYSTSINHPGLNAVVVSSTINCDGSYTFSDTSTVTASLLVVEDTLSVLCPATGGCTAEFGVNSSGTLLYNFTDLSSGITSAASEYTYNWDFGSGNTSNQQNPSHLYQQSGIHQVCLEVISTDTLYGYELCRDTVCRTITVNAASDGQCNAQFNFSKDSLDRVTFTDLSSVIGYQGVRLEYSWDFGDGSNSIIKDPLHFYTSPGVYQSCLTINVRDTITNTILCSDSLCQNFIIQDDLKCNLSFIIDSVNSYTGIVYIWNMYKPDTMANSSTFFWDFGDGNTSTDPYPTHTYTSAGMYEVCLEVNATSADPLYEACDSVWCDSLGVDENGKLLFKNGGGWTLNVLDPKSIGVEEFRSVNLNIYPNPAKGVVNIEFENEQKGDIYWRLQDLNGRNLRNGKMNPGQYRQHQLDLQNPPAGIYLLILENDRSIWHHKTMIEP